MIPEYKSGKHHPCFPNTYILTQSNQEPSLGFFLLHHLLLRDPSLDNKSSIGRHDGTSVTDDMASGLHVQLLGTQPIVVQGQVLCLKEGPVASLELFIKRCIWSDCHLYVFLGNQILCLFCSKFGIFLLSYMLSLYILYISLLLNK